ncbi:cupredoxin domain-containing protein, partial [Patescibacteria group bacterium]|nr:cupredoxin domain-containing protein [Patescibacteria group bacterium]
KEKIKRDENDTEDLDALGNLNESDKDLNESLGDIQDELETESGTSTEEFEKTNNKELEDIKGELEQEQPETTQSNHTFDTEKPQQKQHKEIKNEDESSATSNQEPQEQKFNIEADDSGFYPSSAIVITKGTKVKIEFLVRTTNVYYGGLRFKSPVFEVSAKPGETAETEFTADNSFAVTSYWPLTDVKKADLQIQVK